MSKNKKPEEGGILNIGRMLADELNKHYKNSDNRAYFLGQEEEAVSNVTDFVSTGCTPLDYAIANRRDGGIPVGRITEIYGLEGSGKSLLAAHITKSTQQKGGQVVYIDTESAVSREFFSAIGVDLDSLILIPLSAIEDIFETIEKVIHSFREKSKEIPLTIIVDSIMGATTKKEFESDYQKEGYATDKSIIISKAMRKITNYVGLKKVTLVFTNQLRINLNAGPFSPDKYITSGGKAIPFAASVRIRLKRVNKIPAQGTELLGYKTEAVIDKNRLGPPKRKVTYSIYFSRGMDDFDSILDALVDYSIISKTGAWNSFTYVDKDTGEKHDTIKFQNKDFVDLVFSDPLYNEYLLDQLEKAMIIPYEPEGGFSSLDEEPSSATDSSDIDIKDFS